MKTPSQEQRVVGRLLKYGYITRNQCLDTRPNITRLGAIICRLKKEGWDFDTKEENNDYIYKVKTCPIKKQIALTTPQGTVRLLSTTLFE